MNDVLLGVFDGYMPLERDKLTSETKIGGTPTYFPDLCEHDQEKISKWTTCGVCGRKMYLVVQAFSPLPEAPALHHRMIYIFCCNTDACSYQPSGSWCAFTLQVDLLDSQALNDEQEDIAVLADPLPACELPMYTFPPCYIDIVPQPKKEIVVPTDLEAEMIRVAEENARNSEMTVEDIQELEQVVDLKDKPSDYEFDKFRRKLAMMPSQVIRYYPRCSFEREKKACSSTSTLPLFMRLTKVKDILRIPPCIRCGAALTHELQVMPTSAHYLRVCDYVPANDSEHNEGVDWGTVTLFVCSKNCSLNHKGVLLSKEFIFVEAPPALQDEVEGSRGRVDLRTFMTQLP
ncbi:hypothetical protein TRVL_06366 [Trypanosoma vivax]|uniref:Programmed cell death protein 2 C-terminal domain-containing protein n=1 Tax=Trypanosoma vivax (strain Y486) TaxID=1055687 RepID=G0U5B0_TRYVY|nr:hypothetical protein TRVL_06366 [Trypanosoma vivax]CCC51058.1 conserved hypothetical protein [Trypanosoma vivax Y486]